MWGLWGYGLFGKNRHPAVLTYHSIDDSGSVVSTHPAAFARLMRYLSEKGYQSIRIDTYIEGIRQAKKLDP